MGHDVFISYSNRDKKVADAACARLEQHGHRCWIAPRDILPGQEWGAAIIDGIHDARAFVLIFSGNANASPQVRREVERAVGHGLPLIPFRIEDVVPAKSLEYFISNQHWLDALTPPLDRHLAHLTEVVTRLLAAPVQGAAEPPPTPSEAASQAIALSRLSPRGRSLVWAGGMAVAAGVVAIVVASQLLPAPAPERPVSPTQPIGKAADIRPIALGVDDRAWLYGLWCVDGDRTMTQSISGDEGRLITDFSGQRQIEAVRRAAVGSIVTDVATYSRQGSSVVVSEPGYSYRLEECRP